MNLYTWGFIFSIPFIYYCYKYFTQETIIHLVEYPNKFPKRKYRKWKNYDKKNQWSMRYLKYILKCKSENKSPYGIPLWRYEGIDKEKMTTLQSMYLMNVSIKQY